MGEFQEPSQADIAGQMDTATQDIQNALRIFREHIIGERTMSGARNLLQGDLGAKFRSPEMALKTAEEADSEGSVAKYLAITEATGMDIGQTLVGLSIACRNTAKALREAAADLEHGSRDSDEYEAEAEEYDAMAEEAEKFSQKL